MVPNFNSYNFLKESISIKELENGNIRNLSYSQMKNGFLSKDYEFLGNISFKVKTFNNFAYKEIKAVVPDEICDKLYECGGRDYISHKPSKAYLDTHTFGTEGKVDRLLEVLSEPNIEKVKSCFTNKGDLYYVLWNEENKYFYFTTIDSKSYYSSNNDAIGFLEMFIKIRTSGLEEVTKEVDELYDKYLEKQREEEEKRRIEKEEEEARTAAEKAKKEAYDARVEALKADVEANPDNYEEIAAQDVPKEIADALKSDDYMDAPYVKYDEFISMSPYDVKTVMRYVNDDNFSKGYKYEVEINCSRPGTYWGD